MAQLIKVLIIGCGPHATHFYLPSLMRISHKDASIQIAGILDLEPQRAFIEEELRIKKFFGKTYFISPFAGDSLSQEAESLLNRLVQAGEVNAIIISTDPLNHKSYAKWALSKRIPILMDKPVTTQVNAALSLSAASAIETDYNELLQTYLKHPPPRPPFILCAHRRYHPGIIKTKKLIREIAQKTGCPVTHVHSYHADGQWRLPVEICTQTHHSYNQGHGKVSHSGFHFIDCVTEFWKEGFHSGKSADYVEVFSSFITPCGLLKQFPRESYLELFGNKYSQTCPFSDTELERLFKKCGEVDAEINLTMFSDSEAFSSASISLLHNSYSRRTWLNPGRDLYKGNGRVKHEEHSITIGPFLNIRIQSYQSKDKHNTCSEVDTLPGGNNHFDILVFRNSGMIGGSAFEKFTLNDLDNEEKLVNDRLHITQIKEASLVEWITAIQKSLPEEALLSSFQDHQQAVALMSAIYKSYVKRVQGENPIEIVPWSK